MEYKEIIKDKQAKELIFEAIKDIYDVVSCTFGPNGNTVIIPSKTNYSKYDITKDGVSVVEQIKFKNPVKNIIADFIKDCATRTVNEAGDGTTTATILTYAFIKNCINYEAPSKRINEAFNKIIPLVLTFIDNLKQELKDENIKGILNISSNGDEEITNTIYSIISKTENIKVIEHDSKQDIVEYNEGLTWETSYISKYFINNEKKQSIEYSDCSIVIIEGKLLDIKPYAHIINYHSQNNKPIIFVTEHVHENVLRNLENLYLTNKLKVGIVKTAGMSEHRKNLIQDLSVFTNANIIKGDSVNTVSLDDLGVLKNIYVDKIKTIFVKNEDIDISEYLNNLKKQRDNEVLPEYIKQLFAQRISLLEGALGVIYVGGNSTMEIKERFDRYEDAVKAVLSAKKDGILPGGGSVLYYIGNSLKLNYSEDSLEYKILSSLEYPYLKLKANGTEVNIEDDLISKNIVDPTKVIKSALLNSSSCANTILGTKGVLLTNLF